MVGVLLVSFKTTRKTGTNSQQTHMAMVRNQWYHFGVGAPLILEPILVGSGMFTGG